MQVINQKMKKVIKLKYASHLPKNTKSLTKKCKSSTKKLKKVIELKYASHRTKTANYGQE